MDNVPFTYIYAIYLHLFITYKKKKKKEPWKFLLKTELCITEY